MKVNVKNLIYVGLDFIFENGNPWFIEMNPHAYGAYSIKTISGEATPLKKLSNFTKKYKNFCALGWEEGKKENTRWAANELRHYGTKTELCLVKENVRRRKYLKTVDGKVVEPDCVFKHGHIGFHLRDSKAKIINPHYFFHIADKWNTYKIIADKVFRMPKTFLVKSRKQADDIIRKNGDVFKNGFVIKPRNKSKGRGCFVLEVGDKIPAIRGERILQQRLIPDLIKGKYYWDARVFVVNGEIAGSEMRVTEDKITNVARGAKPTIVPKKILEKVLGPSLKITKALDRAERE
ncbi:MAG: hypothetical protein ISS36_02005 [Candidatus Aenigmarchaeota archaeon]|nr:hypothetical protein [Candidatus Aenigmarchaeota archaeon]